MTVQRVEDEEGDFLLPAAALGTCVPEQYGKQIAAQLHEHAARDPLHGQRPLQMARAELLFGDLLKARDQLEAYAQANTDSFEAHYLLGRAYLSLNRQADATGQFMAAFRLRKLDAPNLYFLARSLDDGGAPGKAVINGAQGAQRLLPSVPEYGFYAAFVSLRAAQPEQAIQALVPFASEPHNAAIAQRVTHTIELIRADKPLAEVMASLQASPTE